MACQNKCECNCADSNVQSSIGNLVDEEAKFDRFDMEQQILQCWNITDDLKQYASADATISAVIHLYEKKFEKLWDMFEDGIYLKKIV